MDYDLLLTGVVLHDIGKIYELNYERGFSYSNEGQLIGHIQIGLRMVGEKLRGLPDFPPELRTLVEHMILSHHGQLEFGSPKLPQFPEALLLHYLDDMDSKMECMRALIENDRQVEGCFTGYNPALARVALKKERFLEKRPSPAAPPAAANGVGTVGDEEMAGSPDDGAKAPAAVASPALASHPLFAAKPAPPVPVTLEEAGGTAGAAPRQED